MESTLKMCSNKNRKQKTKRGPIQLKTKLKATSLVAVNKDHVLAALLRLEKFECTLTLPLTTH